MHSVQSLCSNEAIDNSKQHERIYQECEVKNLDYKLLNGFKWASLIQFNFSGNAHVLAKFAFAWHVSLALLIQATPSHDVANQGFDNCSFPTHTIWLWTSVC